MTLLFHFSMPKRKQHPSHMTMHECFPELILRLNESLILGLFTATVSQIPQQTTISQFHKDGGLSIMRWSAICRLFPSTLVCLMWGVSIYSGLSSFRVMDIWTTNQKKMDFMFERCGRQIENVWEMYVADRWLQSKLDSAAYQRVVDLCNIGKTT